MTFKIYIYVRVVFERPIRFHFIIPRKTHERNDRARLLIAVFVGKQRILTVSSTFVRLCARNTTTIPNVFPVTK